MQRSIVLKPDVDVTLKGAIESELISRGFTIGSDGARVVVKVRSFDAKSDESLINFYGEAKLSLSVAVEQKESAHSYDASVTGNARKTYNAWTHITVTPAGFLGSIARAALSDAVAKLFADQNFVNSVVLAAKSTGTEYASFANPSSANNSDSAVPTEPAAANNSVSDDQVIGAHFTSANDRRVALVVGNGDYRAWPQLKNPANDARLMAATLKSVGFTLVGGDAQIGLDKAAFDGAVQRFGKELPGAQAALFYYSGHGLELSSANFLAPISVSAARPSDVDFQMVRAQDILDEMRDGGSPLNIVILDACRTNPFPRGTKGGEGGLGSNLDSPRGTFISFATAPGSVAADGAGKDSLFAEAWAAAMRKPGLDIEGVINQVSVTVEDRSGNQQEPWSNHTGYRGHFCFAGC